MTAWFATPEYFDKRSANNFSVERQILERLGQHPRIVRYLGRRGALHSDLCPGNILVHETAPGARDLLLADFGGSVCEELGLDGLYLPDGPFYSPVFNWQSSVLLDLFGMGSIFYTIHTGRWPYKLTPGRFDKIDDRLEWEGKVVYPNFQQEKFPDDVGGLPAGEVILACWKREFATAKDALTALDKYIEARGKKCAEPTAVTEKEKGGGDELNDNVVGVRD
ncbi:hypothetical protein MFIFM68171_02051 [Madurella fahalii]|uniref:Protein kinase domain-containing protein n=1 Tax=Madurella fahalii TaxID=1157608 RepID=A0ABQ0G252_9PEZI